MGESANIDLLEDLYRQYQADPSKLDPSWQHYFYSIESTPETKNVPSGTNLDSIMEAYRTYGHLIAKINPIALQETEIPPQLQFGNSNENTAIQSIRSLYCDRVGFEFKNLQNPELENWIQEYIESGSFRKQLSPFQRKLILEFLDKAELFDSFLHTKYVGQKRFSLEGGETLIPMLALLIEEGGEEGLEEIVWGMAHRGRLNVMTNLLNKPYKDMFEEFGEGHTQEYFEGTGDVKYHKGHTSDAVITRAGKKIKVTLTPNPSHLESVDAVVEGQARAKQLINNDTEWQKILPLLIHGDAALSGQGVVYEMLQFSKLEGYTTGGTIHFVVNNQIGFTTVPRDLRSTRYCTDIAKTFGAPVIHVNAEDPEGCVSASLLAWKIRQKFHCDVFVELNCYRKYGHNETDEPAFTQPLEYQIIRKKRPVHEMYREELIQQGVIDKQAAELLEDNFKKELQQIYVGIQANMNKQTPPKTIVMKEPNHKSLFAPCKTGVPEKLIKELTNIFTTIPEGFNLHPKLEHLVKDRLQMINGNKPIDWGMGEYLAYATLLWEGIPIRISGQDSCRGTFSHRHAIWVDQIKERDYFPLNHLKEGQGRFEIYNSTLSEYAVLGFEYGYSVACPQGLTIWEAQFGDFGNGAQIIIDQYIASGEQKWGQKSGLVLYLPHGYEGQGPEHSSGRLERFLALAGHDNMQIVNPTTPAQFFHLLRRQMLGEVHKPLIVFTPKGLLRYSACVNALGDFTEGSFQEIMDDPNRPMQAIRLILCCGRIYYDLIEERKKENRQDIAIVRIEQLYPLDEQKLSSIIKSYSNITSCLWVQEEHQNMGAWTYMHPHLNKLLPKAVPLHYVGRSISASPATGSHVRHKQEHDKILSQVFTYEK